MGTGYRELNQGPSRGPQQTYRLEPGTSSGGEIIPPTNREMVRIDNSDGPC